MVNAEMQGNTCLYIFPLFRSQSFSWGFGTELLRFFPAKKVWITTKKDFEKINRKEAVAKYQMNSGEDSWSIKQMISFKKRLNERLAKLNKQDKKGHMIYFEDLGLDFLFVDETHVYKNLYSYTKLSNVAGVNSSNSLRASDMEMKVKYLLEENNQRGVVFATGTAISNSMSEMFTMQKYLQPDVLEADLYVTSNFTNVKTVEAALFVVNVRKQKVCETDKF